MIEAVFYALFCGFALSALLVPATAFAMRHATDIGSANRHMIWFMVLLATIAATFAAFAVSALRPAQQFSGTFVPTAAPAPGSIAMAAVPLAVLCAFLLACWFIVSIARAFFLARQIVAMRAMKQRGTPIDFNGALPRGAKILASVACVPSAVGFLHPAILLPPDVIGALDSMDARQIVLHEVAHLHRRDDLTGLVFRVCAAWFWFNPFVHYIGRQLSLECEIACDDIVVEQAGDPERYARMLFQMAQSFTAEGSSLAWNGFVHPSGLTVRIQRLLRHGDARHRVLPWPVFVVLTGTLLVSVGLAAFNAPALGRAKYNASASADEHVHSDLATRNHQATNRYQRVRDFPVCNPRTSNGVQNEAKFCEDPTMHSTPSITRIKKGTLTP